MRISELSTRSGVPLATVKYYLREGLLMPGESVSATRAEYGEEHLRRLALVRALTEVVGLSLQKVGEVVALLDAPVDGLFETLGRAIAALPPEVPPALREAEDFPRARTAIERLGQLYDPRFTAVAQLERALAAAEDAGLPLDDARLDTYGEHLGAIAEFDLSRIPPDTSDAVAYAVLGTVVYEPVILALRRLAHQDRAARMLREA